MKIRTCILILFALSAAPVAAQDKGKMEGHPDDAHRNKTAMCIGCHGIPGYRTAFPEVYHVPKIAGQQPGYIINALKAYKASCVYECPKIACFEPQVGDCKSSSASSGKCGP